MRTNFLATACGVLAFAGLTVSAQTPQAPPPAQPTTSAAAARPSDDKATVTVTGCLTSDSKASASASPTGASRSAQYILTNVQETGAPASSTPSTGAGKSYVLKSDAGVDLSAHVNHKVQITGSLDKSAHSSANPSSSAPASEKSHDSMKAATLKVSNLTMVSSTCS